MNFRIRTKITILSVIGIFLSISILSFFTMNYVIKDLQNREFKALNSIKEIKAQQIKDYFDFSYKNIEISAKNMNVISMTNDLINLHKKFKVGAALAFPTDNLEIVEATKKYSDYFDKFVKAYDYYDVLLICKSHGHIMYTQAKESDLGQNLSSGKLKDSNLAQLWRKVVTTGKTQLVDMAPYAPSNGEPVMFLGTPVYDNGEIISILVVQISDKAIDKIMQERHGMGQTGETFLVGEDKLMRNNSVLDPKNHSLKASFANPSTGMINTVSVNNVFANKSGHGVVKNHDKEMVLSSYKAIEFADFRWALIAQITEDEILKPVYELIFDIVLIVIIIFIIFAFVIYFTMSRLVEDTVIKSISGVLCATSEVDSSSTNLSQGAIDLSNMSASQSASVEQISATIEEATENIASNFENMKYLKTIGLEAQKKADTGYSHMKELSKSMQDITDSSQEINTLVNTIDEITFQTNLLALNAAVEAARAGEHGLGFAVVSEEVRSLATRSADESTKIRKVIEKSVEYTQIGDNISKDTTLSFQEILKTIEDTISVISQVTQGSQEQKLAIEELKRAIDSVDGVTQSLSASSEQIAASSQELSEQTNSTKQIVNNLVNMV